VLLFLLNVNVKFVFFLQPTRADTTSLMMSGKVGVLTRLDGLAGKWASKGSDWLLLPSLDQMTQSS
jgi:hypothetical protein